MDMLNARTKKMLEKSWAPIFYQEVFKKIDETPFAVLYSDTGRPSFPVNILLSLEYIKAMKDLSDESSCNDTILTFSSRKRWDKTRLASSHWRQEHCTIFVIGFTTIFTHPDEDLLGYQFKTFLDSFVHRAGTKTGDQRIDSTLFMNNIRKAGRLSLVFDILNRAVGAILEAERSDELAQVLTPEFPIQTLFYTKESETGKQLKRSEMYGFERMIWKF